MKSKTLLLELIEREYDHLQDHEVGTDEYNASMSRLVTLEGELANLEKSDSDKQDRFVKNVIDVGKFVIGGVVVPVVGLVCITATEKDTTFTGALKEYTRLFIPKKMS